MKKEGLTSKQAKDLLKKHGPNKLPEKKPPGAFVLFISQLRNPLVYVLLGAGAVTLFLKEYSDSTIIFLAVVVNTVLGFFQERKAGKALEALKELLHPHVKVIRNGAVKEIDIEVLVPGDIIMLRAGDKIPADGVILEHSKFFVTEAILTGESESLQKRTGSKVFAGTIVSGGNAKALIHTTGAGTEMGRIALSISKKADPTPLTRQLTKFSKKLSILVFALTIIIFVSGVLLGKDATEVFSTSVALAVAAIPEGLLVGLTVVLAIGMQRILKKRGLVRSLISAETLGGVTTICVDKTGTLTEGVMKVTDAVGDEELLAKQVLLANDLDDPVVIASWDWGKYMLKDTQEVIEKSPRIECIPFSSDAQTFTCLNKWTQKENIIFVNGAPEVVLDRAKLSREDKKKILKDIEKFSKEGKRVLGFAHTVISSSKKKLLPKDDKLVLKWTGLLAFSDPTRHDVKESLERTQRAGIRLIVITGDYAQTAISVLKNLGIKISGKNVILGSAIEHFSEGELGMKIQESKDVLLFARTKPTQKLRIVESLKKNGEVVAMMGDGVNDAPALSKADIGIVVEEASDVAKESSDLILLDSSFSTIVSAIEEGRGIFDNIRKIILYLMSDAFEEIFIVIASFVFKFPLPITAAQILWVNLISDGFPDLALTVDSKMAGTMRHGPRSPKEPLVSSWMYRLIATISLVCGIFAFSFFTYVYKSTGNIDLARSVAFAAVGVNSLVYVFSIRTLQEPFWKKGLFDNKWLLGAVGLGFVLQMAPFVFPGVGKFLGVVPLGSYWFIIALGAVVTFIIIELVKLVQKRL